jgi:IclR family acetate operon transcriptional repressor
MVVFKLLAQELEATLNVISVTADLPYSTTYRILETLRLHGLVAFNENDQTWSIGVEAFRIGQGYARRMNFLDVGREVMRGLTDRTGETSNIAVFDNWNLVHVSQIETEAPIRAFVPPGAHSHPHASGIGKALLAHLQRRAVVAQIAVMALPEYTPRTLTDADRLMADLDRTRARGWALDDEERYLGMRCIAAPIFNEFGDAIAGISISGPVNRFSDDRIEALARDVVACAQAITHASGGRQPQN